MQSQAKTVDAYLAELPEDRRASIQAVREVILANLDSTYEEGMTYGMIGYYVPHRYDPAGYHCDPKQPLPFCNLASQKNHMSLYLMCVYGDEDHAKQFQTAWKHTGKKLDMGKSCIRFKSSNDLALDVIAETIRQWPAKKWIEIYEGMLTSRKTPQQQTTKVTAETVTKKAIKVAKVKKGVRKKPSP